jgi:hypothetical protein
LILHPVDSIDGHSELHVVDHLSPREPNLASKVGMLLLGVINLKSLPFVGTLVNAEEVVDALRVVLDDHRLQDLMLLDCGIVEIGLKFNGLVDSVHVIFQSLLHFAGLDQDEILKGFFDGVNVFHVLSNFDEADLLLVLTFGHASKVDCVPYDVKDCEVGYEGFVGCPKTTYLTYDITEREELVLHCLLSKAKLEVYNE